MGGASSKTYVFKPLEYAEIKKDSEISLENYLMREMAFLFQTSEISSAWKNPIQHMITLIRAIHQNQEVVHPILFEILIMKSDILLRLKKYPA